MVHYYISGVVATRDGSKNFDIMEEKDGKQVCIAVVPFHPYRKGAWELARADAMMIVEALNARPR
jgi:hypothetical protein